MGSAIRRDTALLAAIGLVAISGSGGYLLGESRDQSTKMSSGPAAGTPEPARPLFPEPTGTTLVVMVASGQLEQSDVHTAVLTIDIDDGRRRETPIAGGPLRVRSQPVSRDSRVVLVHNKSTSSAFSNADSEARVYTAAFDSPPVVLGHATSVLPSVAPDRAWLLSADGRVQGGRPGGLVREVNLQGQPVTPERAYPSDRQPVAAVEGGLVREVRTSGQYGATLEVWNPSKDEVVRIVAKEPAFLVDARGKWVAWLADTGLHVTDVTTGADRVVQRPSDRVAFTSKGSFSPDGTTLAANTVEASSVGSPQPRLTRFATDEIHPSAWALVDVASMKTTMIPGSGTDNGGFLSPAWSTDSKWFFFSQNVTDPGEFGPNFGSEILVLAFRQGAVTARAIEVVLPRRTGPLIVIP
jgi:hypothetical protein